MRRDAATNWSHVQPCCAGSGWPGNDSSTPGFSSRLLKKMTSGETSLGMHWSRESAAIASRPSRS